MDLARLAATEIATEPLSIVIDTTNKEAQCPARTADKAVYCSCRCANINNQTNDGANYCTCPDGFSCQQLVTSIGEGNEGLTGAYCVKAGTEYDPNTPCAAVTVLLHGGAAQKKRPGPQEGPAKMQFKGNRRPLITPPTLRAAYTMYEFQPCRTKLPIFSDAHSIGRVVSSPSAERTIAATRASASASLVSQCLRKAAPRS